MKQNTQTTIADPQFCVMVEYSPKHMHTDFEHKLENLFGSGAGFSFLSGKRDVGGDYPTERDAERTIKKARDLAKKYKVGVKVTSWAVQD